MLPFKYRHNKIDQVSFRNISTRNQIYYLNVHVHANGDKITSPSLTQATLVRQLYMLTTLLYRIPFSKLPNINFLTFSTTSTKFSTSKSLLISKHAMTRTFLGNLRSILTDWGWLRVIWRKYSHLTLNSSVLELDQTSIRHITYMKRCNNRNC